jgi:hypothetical protein
MIYFNATSGIYGQCTDHCVSGYYLNLTSMSCQSCNLNCSTCVIQVGSGSGNPSSCLTCIANNFLYNSTCSDTCPVGWYSNQTVCLKCMPNCAICTNLTTCIQCTVPYFLYITIGTKFILF